MQVLWFCLGSPLLANRWLPGSTWRIWLLQAFGARIGQRAYLCTGNHNFRLPGFDLRLGPISVGSDAWVAARAVVAPGTRIGPGAVVALGAVVTGVVPPGAIVSGNPAVVVSQR